MVRYYEKPTGDLNKHYNDEELLKMTEEKVEELTQQHNELDKRNREIYNGLGKKKKELIKLAVDIWGDRSNEYRYLKKATIPSPTNWTDYWERTLSRRKKLMEEKKAEQKEKEREEERKRKVERAILWLQARGKRLGEDFHMESAIHVANDIAFDEEVKRCQEAGKAGTYYEFDGNDWCEECEGWDGVSRRCECGNRRVYWDMCDWSDFEDMQIHGVAD